MELNDELKLRVATRMIDKNAATWWDNLKLRSIALVTWDYFVQEFMSSTTLTSTEIIKDKSFSNLRILGGL